MARMQQVEAAVGEDDGGGRCVSLGQTGRIASSSVSTAEFKGSPCGPEKTKVISVKGLVYHARRSGA